ncbi:hypothetical protein EAF04_000714 [Stromatinia cepivora]|nr:hypothetical protein EAF04_000714 [Stromatinia cepivora]
MLVKSKGGVSKLVVEQMTSDFALMVLTQAILVMRSKIVPTNLLCCSASGAIKGCLCCASDPPDCTDSNCLGTNKQACTAPKWDKCGCEVVADDHDGLIEVGDADSTGLTDVSSISSVAAYVFTTIWHADYLNIPGWSVASTDRSFVTTTFIPLAINVKMDPTQCWCTCGPSIYDMTWGTSEIATPL